jgi:hypothetical protein
MKDMINWIWRRGDGGRMVGRRPYLGGAGGSLIRIGQAGGVTPPLSPQETRGFWGSLGQRRVRSSRFAPY